MFSVHYCLRRREEGQIQPHERILSILKETEEASGVKRVGSLAPGVEFFVLGAVVVVLGEVCATLRVMAAICDENLRVLAEGGRRSFVRR